MDEEIDRVLMVHNIDDDRIDAELLYELFAQAGPIEKIVIQEKKEDQQRNNYRQSLVAFQHSESVPYAIALFAGVSLFGKLLELNPRECSIHEAKMREAEQGLNRRDSFGRSPGFNLSPQWGPSHNQRMGGPFQAPTPGRVPFPQMMIPPPAINQLYPPPHHQYNNSYQQSPTYHNSSRHHGQWDRSHSMDSRYDSSAQGRYGGQFEGGARNSRYNEGQYDSGYYDTPKRDRNGGSSQSHHRYRDDSYGPSKRRK